MQTPVDAFEAFPVIHSIAWDESGEVLVNGCTREQVKAVPRYVNWQEAADPMFEAAQQTLEGLGVLCPGVVRWRGSN